MAKFFAKNATLTNNGSKIRPGDFNGHPKHHYEEINFTAELTASDIVGLGTLPKGAKVKSFTIITPVALTTGVIKLGYAPTEKDATDRTADIMAATSVAPAATVHGNLLAEPLAEEKELIATVTTTTVGATGKQLRIGVNYIVD